MADPIFDAGTRQALRTRTFTDKDGILRSERRPNGRLIMMIDSAGNEIPLRLTNAISEGHEFDPYGQEVLRSKTAKQTVWKTDPMVPSLSCPQQTQYEYLLPDHLKTGKRCAVAADGQPIGESKIDGSGHHCICILKLKQERQDRQNKLEASRDEKTTIQQAILNNSQETTSKLTELLGQLMQAPQPPVKGSK